MPINETLAVFCVVFACFCLMRLAVIDLKIRLLPNVWVAAFGLSALVFHFSTATVFLNWQSIFLGALMGGGLLFIVRAAGNFYYKQDSLGLGDVKLMGAAGLWLGADHIMIAIVAGALAGIVHGLALMMLQKSKEPLSTFSLPAGPGFIMGIVIAALVKYSFVTHSFFS